MQHVRSTLFALVVAFLLVAQQGSSYASGSIGLAGHGTYGGRAGWEVTVDAQLVNGSAMGSLSLCPRGCAAGPVFQIVPPSSSSDHWCIAAHRTDTPGGGNELLYVRDLGDGDGVDQWGATSAGATDDCTTFPDAFQYLPLDHGNFHGH
jgi:hypothetical protein